MVSESDHDHSGLLVLTGGKRLSHVSDVHVTYGEGQSPCMWTSFSTICFDHVGQKVQTKMSITGQVSRPIRGPIPPASNLVSPR